MSQSRDLKDSFGASIDVLPSRTPALVGKELVRAYTASRDGEPIDPRRDPAYHNRMLFAGSRS
jgi:hypothetical protein